MSELLESLSRGLEGKSPEDKVLAVRAAFASASSADQQVLVKALARHLELPSGTANDRIWLIIIWAFVTVLVGSAAVLFVNVFYHPVESEKATKPEIVLSLFTAVAGFLAGLVTPSPFGGKANQPPKP